MKIIFLEGVSGVGKSTTVDQLGKILHEQGYATRGYLEGDPESPLDLCWVAYLTNEAFEDLLSANPLCADALSKNSICRDDYVLLRYQVGSAGLYSTALNATLREHEFCYRPSNCPPFAQFKAVFHDQWAQFAANAGENWDYLIFDGSLIGHMASDMLRNYRATVEEMAAFLETLVQTIRHFQPIVFYLSSSDVGGRLQKARHSRGQSPATCESIEFWCKREQVDRQILRGLSVESHILDISDGQWDEAISTIVARIAGNDVHGDGEFHE